MPRSKGRKTKPLEHPRRAFTFDELGRMTPAKARTWEKWAALGHVKTIHLGTRRVVPDYEVDRILREGFGRPRDKKLQPSEAVAAVGI
jgi:hypothetical protein